MPQEIELKLTIAPEHARALAHHPIIEQHSLYKPVTRRLTSIYYDTPDQKLKARGVALRLRKSGRLWLQTVKLGNSAGGGLHSRSEWESETARNTLDFNLIDDPDLRHFLASDAIANALVPVFVTDFRRTQRVLRFARGGFACADVARGAADDDTAADEIEFCIDRGDVTAGDAREALCELELELRAGDVARLFEVARALMQRAATFSARPPSSERSARLRRPQSSAGPQSLESAASSDGAASSQRAASLERAALRLEPRSKAERGYRLFAREAPRPAKSVAPALNHDMSADDGFVAIVQSCLAHLQANEAGALASDDVEYIHQMRVALRRMRSAFTLFRERMQAPAALALIEHMRWLAGELNDARNWDVFVTQTLPQLDGDASQTEAMTWLAHQAASLQHEARKRAQAAVDAKRYQEFLLDLGALLSAPIGGGAPTPAQSISEFAARVLQARHKKLLKRGRRLRELDDTGRHALRIAAKKLRYATDFFYALFPGKTTQRYGDALAQLQDVLGAMNDGFTARELTAMLDSRASQREHSTSIGMVLGWVSGQRVLYIRLLEQHWEEFMNTRAFWR